MASLTVRKLDEAIKAYLRLRSAKNGRSVEEEVRVILREYLEGRQEYSQEPAPSSLALPVEPRSPLPRGDGAPAAARVTLIIGGGIAAYKALDLIRRLNERHIRVRCVLTKAAQQFRHTAFGERAVGRPRLHRSIRSRERVRCRSYPAGA